MFVWINMDRRNSITVLMSAFIFSWRTDRTSTYLAFDGALLLLPLSPTFSPTSQRGGDEIFRGGCQCTMCLH